MLVCGIETKDSFGQERGNGTAGTGRALLLAVKEGEKIVPARHPRPNDETLMSVSA